jgi:stress response protein YsnF
MSEAEPRVVPLDARLERLGEATVIRIPLRAEELRVERQIFVAERVGVRAVDATGSTEETRPLDLTLPLRNEPEGNVDPLRWANRIDQSKGEK